MPQGNYIKVSLQASAPEQEVLIAVLSGMEYYAFEELSGKLDAFIMEADYSEKRSPYHLKSLVSRSKYDSRNRVYRTEGLE